MEPHCDLKPAKHLFKNKGYYHQNAIDRFGFKAVKAKMYATAFRMAL